MTSLPLRLDGHTAGEVRVREDGCVTAECGRREDGLYRAYLTGTSGRALIGVLEPHGASLRASRRFSRGELASLGTLRGGQAVCSFLFDETDWQRITPPHFFAEARLERERAACSGALFRREGKRRFLALPYSPDAPFPIPELFCLARMRTVHGRCCAVYCVDAAGNPIF